MDIKEFLKKTIAYHHLLAETFGGIKEAIYLQQIIFWSDKGKREDGWIYKTIKDFENETYIKKGSQERIKKKLIELNVIEVRIVKANGIPKTHFKINWEVLKNTIEIGLAETRKVRNSESPKTGQSDLPKTRLSDLPKTGKSSITENTTKNTTENTSKTPTKDFFILKDYSLLEEFKGTIPDNILKEEAQKFILYWTQTNDNSTKQKWQKQDTFDVKRRLAVWLKNTEKWDKQKRQEQCKTIIGLEKFIK